MRIVCRLIFSAFLLCAAATSFSQTFATFTATGIGDSSGKKLASGTIYFAPNDGRLTMMSYQIGGVGQTIRTPSSCAVSGGAIVQPCTIANTDLTNPLHVCFNTYVVNAAGGATVIGSATVPGSGYTCVQPSSGPEASSWCSVSGGVLTCNFDNFSPNLASIAPIITPSLDIGSVTTGTPGTSAAASVTGSAPQFHLNLTIPTGAAGPNCSLSSPPGHCDLGTEELDAGAVVATTVSATTGKFTSNASGASLPTNYTLVTMPGDSLAAGKGSPVGGMLYFLAGLLGPPANNQGVGGTTSQQIGARSGAYSNLTITVAGNSIPGGSSCTTTMTWDQPGFEAAYNVNSVVPSNNSAPAPYNNNNGANRGGLWGVVNGVDVQTTYGFWDNTLVPPAWHSDGNYYITAWQNVNGVLQCPPTSTSIPAHSSWAPKFTYPGSLYIPEGGVNDITGGTAPVEAAWTAMMTAFGYGTPTGRVIATPVMYSATYQSGSTNFNNVTAFDSWQAANYPLAVPVVNGQTLLQFLGSLYNPSDPYDSYDHIYNPLLVPPSLRLFTPNMGTITAAITNTTDCSELAPSGGTANIEYFTIDTESIRLNPCVRGYGGTTPATHLIGASYGAKDALHLLDPANQAWALFDYAWIQQKGLLGDFPTTLDVGKMMANPNANLYALLTNRNTFQQDQEFGPRTPATSSANSLSVNAIIAGQYMDSGGHQHDIGGYWNAYVGPGSTPSKVTLQLLSYGIPAGTPLDAALSMPLGLVNTAPATALANSPGFAYSSTGNCWDGGSSSSKSEKVAATPFSAAGVYGYNFGGSSLCGNTFQLEVGGVPVITTPPVDPIGTDYARFRDDFLSATQSSSTTITATTPAMLGDTGWTLRLIGGVADVGYNVGLNASANHPGTLNISTNAASPVSGNGVVLSKDSNGAGSNLMLCPSTETFDTRFVFQLGQATNERFRIGWASTSSGAVPPTYGIWLRFDTSLSDANYTFESVKNSVNTGTVTASFTPGDSATWHNLRMQSTTIGTVQFSLDGGPVTSFSTNIPSVCLIPIVQLVTTTTSNVNATLDFAGMNITGGITRTGP